MIQYSYRRLQYIFLIPRKYKMFSKICSLSIKDARNELFILKYLTSSNGRSIFEPSHQVNWGEGYPPTAWQVTSTSLSADTWLILSRIETAVGFTKNRITGYQIHLNLSSRFLCVFNDLMHVGKIIFHKTIF